MLETFCFDCASKKVQMLGSGAQRGPKGHGRSLHCDRSSQAGSSANHHRPSHSPDLWPRQYLESTTGIRLTVNPLQRYSIPTYQGPAVGTAIHLARLEQTQYTAAFQQKQDFPIRFYQVSSTDTAWRTWMGRPRRSKFWRRVGETTSTCSTRC
jgi:hypothetical protein